MTTALRVARALAFAAGLLACSSRETLTQPLPSDADIHAVLKQRVDSGRTVGIIVGIVENGQRRFVRHGSAGAGRIALDEHTLFEIGSITKTFNALLLADAVARGEVRLDQPVAELLGSGAVVPQRGDTVITLEHLATHHSGLPRLPSNMRPANATDPYVDYDAADLLEFLSTYTLPRAPGTRGEYSNLAAGLLGHALVRRSGAASWEALARDRLTGPLGMRETVVTVPPELRARFAAGHDPALDTVPAWHFDALAGAGALRSTAADMLTYLQAQLEPAATPLARTIPMTLEPRRALSPQISVGLGWMVRKAGDREVWFHNGGTGGFRTFAGFDRARNRGVVVLSNAAVPPDDIGIHLLDPTFPLQMPPVPPRRTAVTLTAAQLEPLVGVYPLTPQFLLSITREGDALFVQPTAQPKLRLWAESPTRFFLREVDAVLEFERDASGRAVAVTLHQAGARQRGVRRP